MRTRKIQLTTLDYTVNKINGNAVEVVAQGTRIEDVSETKLRADLAKEYGKNVFVTVEKVIANYQLDVDGAIKAGYLTKE